MSVDEKYLTPRGVRFITRLAEQGLSDREIAQKMGVSPYSFPSMLKKYEQIKLAIENGRKARYIREEEELKREIKEEFALLKRALDGDDKALDIFLKKREKYIKRAMEMSLE
jgi:transcriptional regulator with XRE-family HTH domain